MITMYRWLRLTTLFALFGGGFGIAHGVPIAAVTTLSAVLTPAAGGGSVALTAQVTAVGNPVTVGSIDFSYSLSGQPGSTSLGSDALDNAGRASVTSGFLPYGNYFFLATFQGGVDYFASSGSTFVRVLEPPPPSPATVTLITSSLNPSHAGDLVTFTSQTFFQGAAPTGLVAFAIRLLGNSTVIESFSTAIDPAGFAAYSLSTLPAGIFDVTSSYAGDALHNRSSGSMFQTVLASTNVPEPSVLYLWSILIPAFVFVTRRRRVRS